jgi:putative membrane-bound dehydrogenase-like protein
MQLIRLGIAVFLAIQAGAAAPDLSSFQIDPSLKIELFASEPEVVDPVALCFDEAGRMYVVEMRDFPYGIGPERKAGGTIRLLEDTDGDGKADKSTVFAKDLSFPTSVAPWKGGVFVTAPPDIIYLKDEDGDGVADVREVYFTGFTLGVTDSNVNGLRWGLDNRLHGVNGGNGGVIKGMLPKNRSVSTRLDDADFSFDPETGDFQTTYQTSGGYGLVFDEFGHSFVTYNINHIQERIVPLRCLNRFPGMFPVEATRSISDHEEMARIFPISEPQTRPNHPEQAGYFSSSGGVGYIGYDVYPGDLPGSVTVGDVVGNLVHRDVLEEDGPIFKARRSSDEQEREFVASRDNACRMTGLELGPDGALYLIDMQRDVIEHPDYIPEKIRKMMNLRAGEDRGRIYRISPRSGLPEAGLNLAKARAAQLVSELESHNQWRRQTAQRLLVETRARGEASKLRLLAKQSAYAPARVQALWTLKGLRILGSFELMQPLKDGSAGVRENALQILSLLGGQLKPFAGTLKKLQHDPSMRVRFQLALSAGDFNELLTQSIAEELLFENRENRWMRLAALSSMASPIDSFGAILKRLKTAGSSGGSDLAAELADVSIGRADDPAGALLRILREMESTEGDILTATLEGVESGLSRNPPRPNRLPLQRSLTRIGSKNRRAFVACWRISRRLRLPETPEQRDFLESSIKTAMDTSAPLDQRKEAIGLLGFGDYSKVGRALFANLGQNSDAALQGEALKMLGRYREPQAATELVAHWTTLAPGLRNGALNLLLSRRQFHNALVTALEKGELKVGELNLDLEQRRTLLRESDPEIQARAAKFVSDEEYSHRTALADDWLKKLPASGEAAKGKVIFEKTCSICHRVGQIGHSVGPDLASVAHRSVADILYNIIDPNMAINPRYLNFQVETKDGEMATGILEGQNAQSVTLLQPSEARVTVSRKDIVKMRSTGTSLMPEGLEAGLTPADLRDLIAFLQKGK